MRFIGGAESEAEASNPPSKRKKMTDRARLEALAALNPSDTAAADALTRDIARKGDGPAPKALFILDTKISEGFKGRLATRRRAVVVLPANTTKEDAAKLLADARTKAAKEAGVVARSGKWRAGDNPTVESMGFAVRLPRIYVD